MSEQGPRTEMQAITELREMLTAMEAQRNTALAKVEEAKTLILSGITGHISIMAKRVRVQDEFERKALDWLEQFAPTAPGPSAIHAEEPDA